MSLSFSDLNWIAILVCIVVGQGVLTLWFTVLLGEPWARAYGAESRAQHTKEVPPQSYAIGLAGVILVSIGTAVLQKALGVAGFGAGLAFGLFMALFYCVAAILPGYAFLKRLDGGLIAAGSQAVLVVIVSVILALWP